MPGNQTIILIVMCVAIFALPYFTITRPQKKREQQRQNMLSQMAKGDTIMTVGGFYALVKAVKEDYVIIELLPDKVKAQVRRDSILSVLEDGPDKKVELPEPEDEEEEEIVDPTEEE